MPFLDKEKAKEYHKLYHLQNWPKRKAKHQDSKRKRRTKLALWLRKYKKDLFCINCKENHPACLDFHHRNGEEKDGTISNMIGEGYSIKTITKEIEKCIVFCRNCHAKAHFEINTNKKI